jgi:hypothetical protein
VAPAGAAVSNLDTGTGTRETAAAWIVGEGLGEAVAAMVGEAVGEVGDAVTAELPHAAIVRATISPQAAANSRGTRAGRERPGRDG